MKKVVIAAVITSLLAILFATFAYAADKVEMPEWYKEMVSWKKAQVTQAVKDGKLTEEQAKAWNEKFDSMQKYHEENGFSSPGMGSGGCRGGFGTQQGSVSGCGSGAGMRGFGWQNK